MIKGLDKLDKLVKLLKKIPTESLKIADKSILFNQSVFVGLNRNQLITEGVDAEGEPLQYKHPRTSKVGKVYTKGYERFKQKKGGNINKVDLSLSGTYLRSLKLDHKRLGVFNIKAEKRGFDLQKELEWNYGPEIHGISENNLQWFGERYIKPSVDERIQQLIDQI